MLLSGLSRVHCQDLLCLSNSLAHSPCSYCPAKSGQQCFLAAVSGKKGGVVHLTLSRGHCIAFWPSVPPLQVAPSFACSVASLSRSPGHQLPGCRSLHCGNLTDYLLGKGRPSTCSTGHAEFQSTSSPSPHRATGDWVLPAKSEEKSGVFLTWATRWVR